MRKHRKPATIKRPARALPAFNNDPAQDDPHGAIEQELLGIWLSVSRLHEMIRGTPAAAGGRVVPLQGQAAPGNAASKKPAPRKPRRKAA